MITKNLITYSDAVEANLVKGRLQDAGINCYLVNENFTTLLPHYSNLMGGGIRLMVYEHDYDKAYNLVYENDLRINEKKVICPGCKSVNVEFSFGKGFWGTILLVLMSLFSSSAMGNLKRKFKCNDCGMKFQK